MIKSAVEIIYNQKFQCEKCIIKTAPAVRERTLNCTGKGKLKRSLDGIEYSRCPGNFYNPGYGRLLDIHRQFRKGVLGFPGGLLDQPAKYLEVMNLMENIITTKEVEQMNAKNPKRAVRSGRK